VLPNTGEEIMVTHMMSVLVDDTLGGTLSRDVTLFGQEGTPLPPGTYRVYKNSDWLRCDMPGPGGEVGVNDFMAQFEVLCDCNKDGTPDDCVTPAGCVRWGGCPADFNKDGTLDFFDYDDFQACFEGVSCPPGTNADFNQDGSVDFFDYDDFIAAFEAGC
jgi:hypothetical protein